MNILPMMKYSVFVGEILIRTHHVRVFPDVGSAAAGLLLFNGDIMGASGIISSVALAPRKGLTDASQSWKLVFLGSFVVAANLIFASRYADSRLGEDSRIPVLSNLGYTLAGLLVGIGTKLGNGCTSGHGICGLGRMSRRSLAAVLTFMSTSIATAVLTSPLSRFAPFTAFLRGGQTSQKNEALGTAVTVMIAFAAMAPLAIKSLLKQKSDEKQCNPDENKLPAAAVTGSMFAAGLAVSGMVLPSKVYGFLDLSAIPEGSFDPTLGMVMLGGVIVSWLSYQFVEGHSCWRGCALPKPVSCPTFSVPNKTVIDWPLITGAALFGIGWGIGGICPGPAIFQAAVGMDKVVAFWWPAFFAGSYCGQQVMEAANSKKC